MCTFLCFALSKDGRPKRAMSAFARAGTPLRELASHPRVNDFPFEAAFFATEGHCDCGTPVGAGRDADPDGLLILWQAILDALDKSGASVLGVCRTWGESWDLDRLELSVQTLAGTHEFTPSHLAYLAENTILVIPRV